MTTQRSTSAIEVAGAAGTPGFIRRFAIVALSVVIISAGARVAQKQEATEFTQLAPHLLVFATRTGNVVASIGREGAFLVGTPSADSTPQISRILAGRTTSPFRYVVIFPQNTSHSEGDAGWGKMGAFVAMHENALGRIGGHAMGPPSPLPPRLRNLGVDRPRISFSEVLCVDINGEAIHVVHQSPGFSDADALVHFHVANLVYLGEVFPGDSYPLVDIAEGGRIDGLIKTLRPWTDKTLKVVPARGKVTNGESVEAFLTMLTTIRARVRKMIDSGQSKEQVLAAHLTTDFDGRWGQGIVSPDAFVQEVYDSETLPTDKSAAPAAKQ